MTLFSHYFPCATFTRELPNLIRAVSSTLAASLPSNVFCSNNVLVQRVTLTHLQCDLEQLICDLQQSGRGTFSLFYWLCTGNVFTPPGQHPRQTSQAFPFPLKATCSSFVQVEVRPDQTTRRKYMTAHRLSQIKSAMWTIHNAMSLEIAASQTVSRYGCVILPLCQVVSQPHLEHGIQFWSQQFRMDIAALEKVPKRQLKSCEDWSAKKGNSIWDSLSSGVGGEKIIKKELTDS